MQRTNIFWKIAFLTTISSILASGLLYAQEDDLYKLEKLNTSQKKLEKVLARTMGRDFDRLETEDFIILRKKTLPKPFARKIDRDYPGDFYPKAPLSKKAFLADRHSFKKEPPADQQSFKSYPADRQSFKTYPADRQSFKTFPADRQSFKIAPVRRPGKIGLRNPTSPGLEESKQVMRNIIDDLVKEKIVADRDSLSWFGLDNSQFVVNGKAVSDSLHTIFKARYLRPDGPGYYYGPVKIAGTGVFFDKENLY